MNDLISISKSKKIMAVFTAVMVAVLLASFGFFILRIQNMSVLARTARSVPRWKAVNTRSVCLHRQWEWEMCLPLPIY